MFLELEVKELFQLSLVELELFLVGLNLNQVLVPLAVVLQEIGRASCRERV